MAKWTRFDPRRKGQFTLNCRQPALNAAVTNTYHERNQGKITKELSLKECRLRSLFLHRKRLFNIIFG